jgi:hypothetical protein
MLFHSFGMFWQREDVLWTPGQGKGFEMLGRSGQNRPGLRIADFRRQTGVYVLYDDWGPYYVGLTKKKGIGDRLKDHVFDDHAPRWNRFSWFGFRSITAETNARGLSQLGVMPKKLMTESDKTIGDVEALLINVLNARGNTQAMKFASADRWEQVPWFDAAYLRKVVK